MVDAHNIDDFTDIFCDEIPNSQESQPLSLSAEDTEVDNHVVNIPETSIVRRSYETQNVQRPAKGTGQYGQFRSVDEIDIKYRSVFSYPFFNLVQSSVIEDALYSDKSMVVCAPTGSGKTVVFEMAIVQLLMDIEDKNYAEDFKIIYMAPVKALCTERLTEWYPKFTQLGLLCIEVTGDTDVDFSQLKPYRIIITTPEKWDMVTRRWREHRQLVEVIKLFLIDEVHILNDESRGPVLEAVVSRMKTIESSAQSAHRIEQLQKQYQGIESTGKQSPPHIRFVAVSATVSNPEDVAAWLGTSEKPAVYYKFGDESRPVILKRLVEGYHCPEGTSIFKFDIILNYKLWPIIQKYHNGKPTLIFCNTRKSVTLTAETLSRELTVTFSPEQKAKLTALASTIKNKKLQALVLSGVGCHHAGLLFEERNNIERAFRNRDLPILITTTTLAMGVNLPAHLVIVKNTQQYVNGAYQEYSMSTILQMVGRAGRPQFDTEATAVIMTRLCDKPRYQALVGGSEPLQSYLHKRLAENLNSEAALGTVNDVAQCVQWLRSTFLFVRAARDPKRYLGLTQAAPQQQISKKIEELCVKAMNGLATSGLITMDEASCIESTEAGRLMSVFYLDLETMKHIMKIHGTENLERLLWIVCESHELSDMHLRVDERRVLNTLNRNNAAQTIRFPMKGKISTRPMKLNCIIQAILGCLPIPEPSLNQEAMKVMRIAARVCKCLVTYVTRPALIFLQPKYYSAVLNALILAKCVEAHLWENSPYISKQLKGIGPTFSTLLATAGKINFMLLEESHPRDLERIMNKGPPAGNVLRKQISLLPKYQLTMTPIDEKSITIELSLLNKNYLADNTDNLTAGDSHKSYIVVGDSENNLLLLTCFKDKDLISVYDGTITHQITRKLSSKHKVYAHCISLTFVGIDAQNEYIFNDLEQSVYSTSNLSTNENITQKPANKQTAITDTFKERKRKNNSEINIAQSKEKKKRDTALLYKFKCLKDSFGKTSKELKEDLDKSAVISSMILQGLKNPERRTETEREFFENNGYDNTTMQTNNINELEIDDFIDDDKINSILSEIENEISKNNTNLDQPFVDMSDTNTHNLRSSLLNECSTNISKNYNNLALDNYKSFTNYNKSKRMQKNRKSNYNFIDLLEKNANLSDEEENPNLNTSSSFSDTIKSQIEKYIQKTKTVSNVPGKSMELLKSNSHDRQQKIVINQTSKAGGQNLIENKSVSNNQLKRNNESPATSQLKTQVHIATQIDKEGRSLTTQDDDAIVVKETEGQYYDMNLLSLNESVHELVGTNSCLEKIRNCETEEPIPVQNTTPDNKFILNSIDEKQNSFKTNDSILFQDNNVLCTSLVLNVLPFKNKNVDANKSVSINQLKHNESPATSQLKTQMHIASQIDKEGRSLTTQDDHVIVVKQTEGKKYDISALNLNETVNEIVDSNSYLEKITNFETEEPIPIQNTTPDNMFILTITDEKQNNFKTNDANVYQDSNVLVPFKNKYVHANHNTSNTTLNLTRALNTFECLSTDIPVLPISQFQLQHFVKLDKPVNHKGIMLNELKHIYSESGINMESNSSVLKSRPEETVPPVEATYNYNTDGNVSNSNKNIRKYSYSTTNINVATKNTPDHVVRVIRKIKMDLDITEIISRNKEQTIKLQEIESEKELKLNDLMRNIIKSTENHSTDNIHLESHSPKSGRIENNEMSIMFYPRHKINDDIIDGDIPEISTMKTYEPNPMPPKITLRSPELGLKPKQAHKIPCDFHKKDIDGSYKTVYDNILGKSTKEEGNRFKHILQKYSQMLSQNNNTGNLSENLGQPKYFNKGLSNKAKRKSQRPFKITDINKLITTLPATLISKEDNVSELSENNNYQQINNTPSYTNLKVKEIEEHFSQGHEQKENEKYHVKEIEHYICDAESNAQWQNFHKASIIQNEDMFGNVDEDIDTCKLLTIGMEDPDLEQSEVNMNIDHSMLNPQTLLHCMSNGKPEYIVPPPPEFRDKSKLTPENEDYEKIPADCYEPFSWNNLNEKSHTDFKDSSIFQDYSCIELTPSKELETWTLSQNDESYEHLAESTSLNPTKSFTMMRNSGQHRSPFQNASVTRRSKLGQFKYCRKSKLKPKI